MSFLLQQGWGMMAIDVELVSAGVAAGVILSPRVSSPEQLAEHAEEIRDLGGQIHVDPQFYVPATEHSRIRNFPFWNGIVYDTTAFAEGGATSFCDRVIEYELELQVNGVLLPGAYTNTGDSEWRDMQACFVECGAGARLDRPVYMTLAVGPDLVANRATFDVVVDEVVSAPVQGVYFLVRHPNDQFLVSDDSFLYGLLDALLSVRLSGKDVIAGYSNQQGLLYASAGVDTIASGNFRNVRHFNPDIFDVQEETDIQRATWYYDGWSLSEFRIAQIALAYRRGMRDFGPPCDYCEVLLAAPQPSAIPWREPDAFRHHLFELSRQWRQLEAVRRGERAGRVRGTVEEARTRLNNLLARRMQLGERSFYPAVSPSLNALEGLIADRGADLATLP